MQQDIARHTQVGIQPAIHDQGSDVASIAEDTHTKTETTGGNCPQDDDVGSLPTMRQWELVKVGPPEEQPQAIVGNHGDDLYPKGYAVLHCCLHISNRVGSNQAQRAYAYSDDRHVALASIDIYAPDGDLVNRKQDQAAGGEHQHLLLQQPDKAIKFKMHERA